MVACQIDFSMNTENRVLDILIEQNDDLQEALSDALNNRDAWKDCAEAFFLCAGKDKTASWDQFEKAATLYQQLKSKP
jgi:hypothetical protein